MLIKGGSVLFHRRDSWLELQRLRRIRLQYPFDGLVEIHRFALCPCQLECFLPQLRAGVGQHLLVTWTIVGGIEAPRVWHSISAALYNRTAGTT